jgi:predicted AAA+ superfamily ATPase
MVIADICKTFTNKGQEPPLTFWRDKTGHEIDLLVESGGKLQPIEIKSGQTISKDFFKDLKYYNDLSGQKEARSSLIYGGDNNQIWNDIRVRSWKKTDPLD